MNLIVKASSPYLIQFLFPKYVIREEVSILDSDKDVIYIGPVKNQLKKYLADRTHSYISLVGPAEKDLTKNEELLNFVAELKGRKVPKRVLDMSEDLTLSEVESLCKTFYVSNKWLGDDTTIEVNNFNLYESVLDSPLSALRVYFELRKVYPFPIVRNSFLTFLGRVVNIEEAAVKPGYMKVLKRANEKFGKKVRQYYYDFVKDPTEENFICLLLNLR